MKNLRLFICLLICSHNLTAQPDRTITNEEKARYIKEDEEKKSSVRDLFSGREVYISSQVRDRSDINRHFFKTVRKFYVDFLTDGLYFSWEEVLGEQSMSGQLLYTYSVKVPYKEINAIASYYTTYKPPIGTEKDHRKIASVVFQAKKGKQFETFESSYSVEGSQKTKRKSEYVKNEFLLIPYAFLDPACSSCTHESLTIKPREALLKFVNEKLGVVSTSSPATTNQNSNSPTTLFRDDFTDNTNSWMVEESSQFGFKISEGKYKLQSKTGGRWLSTIPISVNTSKDFQVTAIFRKTAGTNNYFYGLTLGRNVNTGYHHFAGITGNGHAVFANKGPDSKDLTSAEINNAVMKGNAINKITLKKANNKFSFLVNDQLIGESAAENFFGNYFGFQLWSGNESLSIEVDEIVISAGNNSTVVSNSKSESVANGKDHFCNQLMFIINALNNGKLGDVVDYNKPLGITRSWYESKVSLSGFEDMQGQSLLGNLSYIAYLKESNKANNKSMYDELVKQIGNCLPDFKKSNSPYGYKDVYFQSRKNEDLKVDLEYSGDGKYIRIRITN